LLQLGVDLAHDVGDLDRLQLGVLERYIAWLVVAELELEPVDIAITIIISSYQHINISTYQHINISTYQHIKISTHQHINISTHQHINTSTYQHINISTYQHINISRSKTYV